MESNLKIALNAALEAGKAILEIYCSGNFDVEIKDDQSPLTKADIASHKIIISYLEKTNIPILSEEGENIPYKNRKDWSELWIVDPIDGTKEFIKKNGEFTVNIALVKNQEPILGIILVPNSGELYFSRKNKGAFKAMVDMKNYNVDDIINQAKRLPIAQQEKRPFTIVASKSHMTLETKNYLTKLQNIHGEVNLISKGSSLKLCMVAEGRADCYPRFAPTMEWDTAAGQAICNHAGFDVIDWKTKKTMLYNRKELLNSSFLVKAF